MTNYFDAYEAVDELIDDVNTEYYEGCYEEIYEEICRRVDEGELSLEDGEILNEAAADKYLYIEEKVNIGKLKLKTKKQKAKEEAEAKKAKKKKIIKNAAIGAGIGAAAIGGGIAAHKTGLDTKALNGVKSIGSSVGSKLPKSKKKQRELRAAELKDRTKCLINADRAGVNIGKQKKDMLSAIHAGQEY